MSNGNMSPGVIKPYFNLLLQMSAWFFVFRRCSENEGSLAPVNDNRDVIGKVAALHFRRHPEPMTAIDTKLLASAFSRVFGVLVELITVSQKAIREDPGTNFGGHNQLHRVVAKPEDFAPSPILNFVFLKPVIPFTFLHVFKSPS
jgi:hypothetical protein